MEPSASAAADRSPAARVYGMLVLRSLLGFLLLAALAAGYAFAGAEAPWRRAAAWWLWILVAVNLVSLGAMARLSRAEGGRLRDCWFPSRGTWKGDLAWLGIGFLGSALLAQLPGELLARLFWGGSSTPNSLLFGPLPEAAIWPLMLLFPPIHGLAELPLYWGFVDRRLRARGMAAPAALVLVAAFLSLQHLAFSFQPDARYALWLALKFFPFALWTGFLLRRRPTVMPYLMGMHALLDAALPWLALHVSRGGTL